MGMHGEEIDGNVGHDHADHIVDILGSLTVGTWKIHIIDIIVSYCFCFTSGAWGVS